MDLSNAYRALAMSVAVLGGLLIFLGWIAGGGGFVLQMNAVSVSLLIGGVGMIGFGPWFILFHYQTILRRQRAEE